MTYYRHVENGHNIHTENGRINNLREKNISMTIEFESLKKENNLLPLIKGVIKAHIKFLITKKGILIKFRIFHKKYLQTSPNYFCCILL